MSAPRIDPALAALLRRAAAYGPCTRPSEDAWCARLREHHARGDLAAALGDVRYCAAMLASAEGHLTQMGLAPRGWFGPADHARQRTERRQWTAILAMVRGSANAMTGASVDRWAPGVN